MEQTQATQIANNFENLFKLTMNIYWNYLGKLKEYAQELPETKTEAISNVYAHIEEVKEALAHDISMFEEAIQSDKEDLHGFKDQLKIADIQKKLKS